MIDGDLTTIVMMINLYRFLTTSVTSSILWISLSECMKVNIIDLSHSVRTKKTILPKLIRKIPNTPDKGDEVSRISDENNKWFASF